MGRTQNTTLSFLTDDEERHELRLEDIDEIPVDRLVPFRTPRSHHRQKHMPGWYWFQSTGTHVYYESRLELQALKSLDFDVSVAGIWAQPFRFAFKPSVNQDRKLHVPDYFAKRRGKRDVVVDVKRAEEVEKEGFRRTASLTREACEGVGLDYLVISEFDPKHKANLDWLSHFRHESLMLKELREDIEAALIECNGCSIEELSTACGPPLIALPVIFHLMWKQVIQFDMNQILTERSFVNINEEEKDV